MMKRLEIKYLKEVLVPVLCKNCDRLSECSSTYRNYLIYNKDGTITIEQKLGGNKIVTLDDILGSDVLFFNLEMDLKKLWDLSLYRNLDIFKSANHYIEDGWIIEIDKERNQSYVKLFRRVFRVRHRDGDQFLENDTETRVYGIVNFLYRFRDGVAKI